MSIGLSTTCGTATAYRSCRPLVITIRTYVSWLSCAVRSNAIILMRLRFTIRDLLLATAVMAVTVAAIVRYAQTERAFANATLRYEAAAAKNEAGLSTTMELCAESFILYAAERDRWFQGHEALTNHVNRLRELERRTESTANTALYSDEFGAVKTQQKAADIRALRERFERGDF
jgi:hypothetical protein